MSQDEFPPIGFGTYQATGDACTEAVETALEVGYRHIDTAEMYENQTEVGRGIANAAVPRADIHLATKLNSPNLAYDDVLDTAAACRERLGVDVIDLLYIHWPIRTYDPNETLPALDELHDRGEIRNIGLSNFTPELLEEAIDILDAPVFAHQVECHPFLPQEELRQLAAQHDHYLVAYSPIARGDVFDDDEFVTIADSVDVTPAQLALAWLMERDRVVPIPKSATPDHIRDNFATVDIKLDQKTIERIDALDRSERLVDFPAAPWNAA